jgi:hypothetical protein
MIIVQPPAAEAWRDRLAPVRRYLGDRRTWMVLAVLAVGGGLALNWGWLAAAGVAPLLLTLLPCAAMCVLGHCMSKSPAS